MMAKKHICPTCELEQPQDRAPLRYFAQSQPVCPAADDLSDLYEDTHKVLQFLGAVAHAIGKDSTEDEEGMMWLSWLAEALTEEAQRRLLRLQKAGRMWQTRAIHA